MDLGEIGFGGVDWIHLAQDRDRAEIHIHIDYLKFKGYIVMFQSKNNDIKRKNCKTIIITLLTLGSK
jgi:hypothetical protein